MEILNSFFNKEIDNKINKQLLELNYSYPKGDVLEYITTINQVPVDELLSWIDCHTFFTLDATDMPQTSKFEDAFYNIVFKLMENEDLGFRYVDMGRFLQDDGITRSKGTDRKYGENHAKASEYVGYLFSLKYRYYVSCFGYALPYLCEEQRDKLYTRLLIRTNLFKSVYLTSKKGKFKLYELLDMVSPKTYERRRPGTKKILESLKNSCEYDFSSILDKIIYK